MGEPSLREILAGDIERGQPPSAGQMLDTKLEAQEQRTRLLETRVRQLEMIARAHGLIPPEGPDATSKAS